MILFALFIALHLFVMTKYFEGFIPSFNEQSYQTGYRNADGTLQKEYRKSIHLESFIDPKEHARRELEYASQRIAVYLYQVSRRGVNGLSDEPSFQDLWAFIGSGGTGSINLSGNTSPFLNYITLRDGSYGRYLLRNNTLFSEISKYQYDYDLREVGTNSRTPYGYQDFIKVR